MITLRGEGEPKTTGEYAYTPDLHRLSVTYQAKRPGFCMPSFLWSSAGHRLRPTSHGRSRLLGHKH